MKTCIASVALLLGGVAAAASPATDAPLTGAATNPEVRAGIDQKLGKPVTGDISFLDEGGEPVTLRSVMGRKPIILVPVYYRCPSVCNLTLTHVVTEIQRSGLTGDAFELVVFSFDPQETSDLAREKKMNYIKAWRGHAHPENWHFWTARAGSIQQITQAVGFRYRWDEAQRQFVHPSSAIVISPKGVITQYLNGVTYPSQEMKQAVTLSALEKTGKPSSAFQLLCIQLNVLGGRYNREVIYTLRAAAVLTLVLLGWLIVSLIRRHARSVPATAELRTEGGRH